MENVDVQNLVKEIQQEDLQQKSSIRRIIHHIDRAIENSGNNKIRIGKLLQLKYRLEQQFETYRPIVLSKSKLLSICGY